MKKRKTRIAFSIFDKPSLAAFCIKIASLPEQNVGRAWPTCAGSKKNKLDSSEGESASKLEEVACVSLAVVASNSRVIALSPCSMSYPGILSKSARLEL